MVGIGTVTFAPQTPGSLVWVMSAGQVIVGASLSTTVTVNWQVAVSLGASSLVAVNSTMVSPIGNKLPVAGPIVWVTVTEPPSGSIAPGVAKFTIAPHSPGSLFAITSLGQAMIGGTPFWVNSIHHSSQVPPSPNASFSVRVQSPLIACPANTVFNNPPSAW